MNTNQASRREQLIASAEAVAALATNRTIVPQHVSKLEADHEIRKILDAVVKRWTRGVSPSRYTQASVGGKQVQRQQDHLVPCRVLVDRMIMNPNECRALLETAVVLVEVSGEEHRRLGGIYADHEEVYGQMLNAPVSELEELGLLRYDRKGIETAPYIF